MADTENYLKKNDPGNAAIAIEKALKIVQSKKLIHKAVSIHRLLENENKVFELEQILKKMERDEIQIIISEKNCPNNRICLFVSAVPRFATQLNI